MFSLCPITTTLETMEWVSQIVTSPKKLTIKINQVKKAIIAENIKEIKLERRFIYWTKYIQCHAHFASDDLIKIAKFPSPSRVKIDIRGKCVLISFNKDGRSC